MTVHVHRDNTSIHVLGHEHRAPADLADKDRTWSFDCPVDGCEDRVLHDVEHTARTANSVPLTVSEVAEEEVFAAQANRDTADLARGLAQLAKERGASRTAA